MAKEIEKLNSDLDINIDTPKQEIQLDEFEGAPIQDDPLNVLSLFSGCGGMDLGFEGGFTTFAKSVPTEYVEETVDDNFVRVHRTRFRTVFANDILKEAQTAWTNYFKKRGTDATIYHTESIVDLVKRHRAGEQVFPENIDVVTGGFPCQDFSVSGNRLGFESHKDHNGEIYEGEIPTEETRGKLYFWMKEVIDITRPKIFIAENVKGLVNLADVKDIIQRDFSSAGEDGYLVLSPQVLHAADYGVPQSRERVIFIGIRKDALTRGALRALSKEKISDKYNPYPNPTHRFTNRKRVLPFVRLSDVFSVLQEPEQSNDLSQKHYSKAKYMGEHCQGQKEISLKKIGPTIRSEHHGNIEYRRLSRKHKGKNRTELKAGLSERRLTVRECANIQTFPMDFEFVIPNPERGNSFLLSSSGGYKVIGNAVPPLLAYNIARRLENLWSLYFG